MSKIFKFLTSISPVSYSYKNPCTLTSQIEELYNEDDDEATIVQTEVKVIVEISGDNDAND